MDKKGRSIHIDDSKKGGNEKVRKKRRKLLAAILAAAMLIPQSVMTVGAADLSSAQPVYQVNSLEVTDLQDVSADG